MPRQSISLTEPNNDWLSSQVKSREYSSKSEVVNDLIRKAREIEAIRSRLVEAEQSGFIERSRAQLLKEIRNGARKTGKLSTE